MESRESEGMKNKYQSIKNNKKENKFAFLVYDEINM